MNRIVVRAVLAAVAVVGIVYGIRCVSQYRHNRKLELQGRNSRAESRAQSLSLTTGRP